LLATSSLPIDWSFHNIPIGHGGITDQNVFQKTGIEINSPSKVDITQVGSSPFNFQKSGGVEITAGNSYTTQFTVHEVSSGQISSSEISVSQINRTQVGITEINPTQVSITEINPTQVNSTEIPLPSSIPLQQFLSSHNFNLQNTTIPTWTDFLTGTTLFNLNIEITDLPTGQLAVRAALLNFHRAVKEGRYQLE
jgi:hypothetical protein